MNQKILYILIGLAVSINLWANYEYQIFIDAQKELKQSVFANETFDCTNDLELTTDLQNISGVDIHNYGAIGALSSINVHGSSSSQILFAVEDVPVNSAQSGNFDLSLFPGFLFQKISFIKGGSSAIYGANASSGYVNFNLKQNSFPSLKATFITGSFETFVGNIFCSLPVSKQLSFNQNIYLGYSKNNYPFTNNGINSIRSNSAYQHLNSVTRFQYKTHNLSSSFSLLYNHKKIGVPGAGIPQNLEAYQLDKNLLTISKTQIYAPLFTELLLSYFYSSLHYNDPLNPFGPPIDSLHQNHQFFLKLSQSFDWNFINLFYGFENKYNTIQSTDITGKSRNLLSQFSSLNFYFLDDNIKLALRYRYEYSSLYEHILTYNAGYNIQPFSNFIVWGNLGTSFREPTFNDLYWPDTGMAKGNPDLLPEISHNFEIGMTYQLFKGMTFKGNYFENFYTNIIAWAQNNTGMWSPQNIRRALYQGFDFDSIITRKWVETKFHYSKLYPRILSHDQYYGKFVPDQPFDRFSLSLKLSYSMASLSCIYRYTGFSYTTPNNTISTATINEEYSLIDLQFQFKFKNWRFDIYAKNILNQYYTTQQGYALPGFNFLCSMTYQYSMKGGDEK